MIKQSLISILVLLSLTACGGGSSSGGSTPPASNNPPPSPPPTSVTTNGVITGFSSVIVNGVTYAVTSTTEVAIEGSSVAMGDDSSLKVGMRVRLRGADDNGSRSAERIDYDDDLKGPARDVQPNPDNPETGSFQVLGQTVIVDDNTVFDNDVGDNNSDGQIDIRDLVLTSGVMVVEVSGLLIDSGYIATRIDRRDNATGRPGTSDDEFELKGFVDSVAADGSSFVINGATVLVQGNTIFEDNLSPDASLAGIFVEVKLDEASNGDLLVVSVEREDDFGDRNGDGDFDADDRDGRFEIKGILSRVDTSGTPHVIVIGPTTLEVVDASSLTGFEGSLIEVKGDFNDAGVLMLSSAERERENSVRTEDRVAEVDTAQGNFTTRLGLLIQPGGGSRLEDDIAEDGDHLTPQEFIQRLAPGDFIEARGVPADAGVTWTRVQRADEDDQACELQGPVSDITGEASSFEFVIEGVSIDVSQVQNDDFESAAGIAIGRTDFFDQLSVGDIVKAQSDDTGNGCTSGRLTAREVEFELNDGVVGSTPGSDGIPPTGGNQLTGTPSNVMAASFELQATTVTVVASTLIDDSIIERALGREFDGDDQRFDQIPAGLTLADLLTGDFSITVRVNSENVALEIEDL
ncbi:MAG: DUF5666 domain-containing protein [Pseudomonadales bacterium]